LNVINARGVSVFATLPSIALLQRKEMTPEERERLRKQIRELTQSKKHLKPR
jgi:hypothetical protein